MSGNSLKSGKRKHLLIQVNKNSTLVTGNAVIKEISKQNRSTPSVGATGKATLFK